MNRGGMTSKMLLWPLSRRCMSATVVCLILSSSIVVVTLYNWASGGGSDWSNLHHHSNIEVKVKVKVNPKMQLSEGNMRLTADGILEQMGDEWQWGWIKNRVQQTWREWVQAAMTLRGKQDMSGRKILKIIVAPGVLSLTSFAQPAKISGGGPLGELVQWSDLVSALHLLGHNVTLRHTMYSLIEEVETASSQQTTNGCDGDVNLILTDIAGYNSLPNDVKTSFRSKFRILDSFGTEAMFNEPMYAVKYGLKTPWSPLGLNLKQFYTLYPHTPDNSFLGFLVPSKILAQRNVAKRKVALLYGKDAVVFNSMYNVIEVLLRYVEVEATADESRYVLPSGIKNHGVLKQEQYHRVIEAAKIFVGSGDPKEGPAGLEALAKGCVVFQPRFTPAVSYKGKPTSRSVSSQNPYLEDFIGPPHVFTINYHNLTEVEEAIKRALDTNVEAFIPYEFTAEGYLQRISAFNQHLDFCSNISDGEIWPPESSLRTIVGQKGASCNTVCATNGFICESAFFRVLNTQVLGRYWSCAKTRRVNEVYAPGYHPDRHVCLLQNTTLLFSCSGLDASVVRICPCRDYIKHQVSLCKDCVR